MDLPLLLTYLPAVAMLTDATKYNTTVNKCNILLPKLINLYWLERIIIIINIIINKSISQILLSAVNDLAVKILGIVWHRLGIVSCCDFSYKLSETTGIVI